MMTQKKPKAQSKTAIDKRDASLGKVPVKQENNRKRKPTPSAWVKGQSGNLAGRPKKGNAWTDIINEVMEAKAVNVKYKTLDFEGKAIVKELKLDAVGTHRNIRQLLAVELVSRAMDGDISATKTLIEHEVGKAVQTSLNANFNPDDLPEIKEGEDPLEWLLARFAKG